MNTGSKKSDHYNPIKDKELYKGAALIENIDEGKQLGEEWYNAENMERRARIERSNYIRMRRKEFYHLRLSFAFIGVGVFSLISGYTVAQLKHKVSINNEESVLVDSFAINQGASSIIYQDWKLKLVNDSNPLHVINIPELSTLVNGIQVDERIAEDLERMIATGKTEAGLDILVVKGYISRVDQIYEYNKAIDNQLESGGTYLSAYNMVEKSMCKPGTNERELGLTVYLVGREYQHLDGKQADTATAIWLSENSSRFGFVLRYPEGKSEITGEKYQPWCFRYVGTNVAPNISGTGITLEEYLNTK